MMTNFKKGNTSQESETLFLQFLHAYLDYLIYVCRFSLDNDLQEVQRKQKENSLANSLTLIWQLHVGFSMIKTYYKITDDTLHTSFFFDHEQSEQTFPLLREMKLIIEAYPFLDQVIQQLCLALVEQIQSYYEQDNIVIVGAYSHAAPWLAKQVH